MYLTVFIECMYSSLQPAIFTPEAQEAADRPPPAGRPAQAVWGQRGGIRRGEASGGKGGNRGV